MRFKSIFAFVFMVFALVSPTGLSAEIFELVNDYDITAGDIESADFNNDGLDDFAVADWIIDSSYYEVFLSNGDCSFTRLGPVFVDTSYFAQLLTGNFNEDSNEDLLLMSVDETRFYAGDGTGNFSLEDTFPWSLCNGCTGDVNNDDHLDLAGVNSLGNSVAVMLGDGLGHFTQEWESVNYDLSSSCKLAYFNDSADTNLDLCIACGIEVAGVLVFQGTGDGSFTDSTFYEITENFGLSPTFHCTCGDFNENGYTDIAIAGSAGMSEPSTFIFLNQQDGTFKIPEHPQDCYFYGACDVERMATADLDLDGHLDLALAYGGGASIAGYGDGTFNGDWTEILSDKPWVNFVFMDMDLDGDLDLADKGGRIFRNTTINLSIEEESSGSITNLALDVSPNPFYVSVTIKVSGYYAGSGNLQIFDMLGRLVTEFEFLSSERESVYYWDGVSSSGTELPSGIYTVRLSWRDVVATATLLKLE